MQMLRNRTTLHHPLVFQCLGRAKNIDFFSIVAMNFRLFLNFMLFIGTNIYKSYTVYDYGNPIFLTGLYKIYLEDLCCELVTI